MISTVIFVPEVPKKKQLMIDANDIILERVANNIDEMNGIKNSGIAPVIIQTMSAKLPVNGSWNCDNNATFSVSSSITSEKHNAKNIVRPQKFFKDKIDNSSNPWKPRIKDKPNSLKPLAIFLEESENGEEYCRPYEFELERFTPMPEQLRAETPTIPPPIENTLFTEISKPEQVDELVDKLGKCKEFAVDLEHHSSRSFLGFTCLMQISTRDTDYIIDTLALRDKLHLLNEVFTKPSIVKILHGADNDIKWMQRDLSLYVVNMFDTYQAAKLLEYSELSLAYLLQIFCQLKPNKKFQMADWRIRPLPNKLKMYAREDTHYLIYIYQVLKNELLNKANGKDNLLLEAIHKSTELCNKRYFKPTLKEDSHLDLLRKHKRMFDNRQLYALKELYRWRDQISRGKDESTGFVLPNKMLLQISETLPSEMHGILACCKQVPPLVKDNLLELHQIILLAMEQPLEKPILKEDTRARGTTNEMSKINVDSPLHCPRDLTKTHEFRDDRPTLLGKEDLRNILNRKNSQPVCSVLEPADNSINEFQTANEIEKKVCSFKFFGPFERYKLVKPYIQAKLNNEDIPLVYDHTDKEQLHGGSYQTLIRKSQPPSSQTLTGMGESIKRKRNQSPLNEPDEAHTSLYRSVPNLNGRDYPRKRRSSYFSEDRNSENGKNLQMGNREENDKRTHSNNKDRQREAGKEKANVENHGKRYSSRDRTEQYQRDGYSNRPGENRYRSRRDQSRDFTTYDYSSDNFRRFHGGAGGASRSQEFKSSFRSKDRRKDGNRRNNRSPTFEDFGRDRGSPTFGDFGRDRRKSRY